MSKNLRYFQKTYTIFIILMYEIPFLNIYACVYSMTTLFKKLLKNCLKITIKL